MAITVLPHNRVATLGQTLGQILSQTLGQILSLILGSVLRQTLKPHRPMATMGARARAGVLVACAGMAITALGPVLTPVPAQGQVQSQAQSQVQFQDGVSVSSERGRGYVRFVFTWPEQLADTNLDINASVDHRVLVARFARPVRFNPEVFEDAAGDLVAKARLDPAGDTLRLALKTMVRVSTSRSHNMVSLDLILDGQSPPPAIVSPRQIAQEEAQARRRLRDAQRGTVLVEDGEVIPELDVQVSYAQSALYSRIVFTWSDAIDFDFSTSPAGTMLQFAAKGQADLTLLNADLPRGLDRAVWWNGDTGSGVDLSLLDGIEPRVWSDEGKVVIDLIWRDPEPEPELAANTRTPSDMGDGGRDAGNGAKAVDHDNHDSRQPSHGLPGDLDRPDEEWGRLDSTVLTSAVDQPATDPGLRLTPRVGQVSGATEMVVRWPAAVGAAAFRRDDAVWLVFDAPALIDVSPLRGVYGVSEVTAFKGPDYTAVRMTTKSELLPSLSSASGGRTWALSLSVRSQVQPRQLVATVETLAPGAGWVSVDLRSARRAVLVNDPVVGDSLVVVTAPTPSAGFVSRLRFAEIDVLASVHGIAVSAMVDAIDVAITSEDVQIGRRRGLAVTADVIADSSADEGRATAAPAFIDFDGWAQTDRNFFDRRAELVNDLAMADDPGPPSVALARFLLGREYAAEALGVIENLIENRPQYNYDLRVAAMHGVALAELGRWADARRALSLSALSNSPSAALWRGYIAAKQGDWPRARAQLYAGEPALYGYNPKWQARFLSVKARAALELSDLQGAKRHAQQALSLPVAADELREANLVLARLNYEQGDFEAAMEGYRAVDPEADSPQSALAQFYLIAAEREAGMLTPDETRDALEALYFRWRGDDLEVALTEALARDSLDRGDTARGLRLMRDLLTRFPDNPRRRDVTRELSRRFNQLFLEGGADVYDPVEALSLWYEFRDLTPAGSTGDRMIRRLADRLVDVDLLPQAAELLTYQIEERLIGPSRAVVASDLATVHLLDRNPQAALGVLASTRFAQLPKDLVRERRLIQARALAEMNRADAAIDLLQTDRSAQAARLRSDIAWNTGDWSRAGTFILEAMGPSWRGVSLLPERVESDVLRAAVAMTLADDDAALASLVDDYGEAMAAGGQAGAWALVATTPDVSGATLRTVASRLADEATLDQFVDGVRARRTALPDDAPSQDDPPADPPDPA